MFDRDFAKTATDKPDLAFICFYSRGEVIGMCEVNASFEPPSEFTKIGLCTRSCCQTSDA